MKKFYIVISIILIGVVVAITNVKAQTIEDIVNNKEVTLKMATPTNLVMKYFVGEVFEKQFPGYSLMCDEPENLTGCSVYQNNEDPSDPPTLLVENVTLKYEYDEDILRIVNGILGDLKNDPMTFYMNDIEFIAYLYANDEYIKNHPELENDPGFDGYALEFPSFSSDLKKHFGYSNFEVRVGMGEALEYYQEQIGDMQFWYNGTLYGLGPQSKVILPYVVYVPTDATNIEQAIKDRLSLYYKIKKVYEADEGTIEELLNERRVELGDDWDEYAEFNGWVDDFGTKDNYIESMMNEEFYDEDAPGHFMTLNNIVSKRYMIVFDDGFEDDEDNLCVLVVVVKDDTKASDARKVITNDAKTGVKVETTGIIPLDTLIQVAKITEGADYTKIVNLLKVTNLEMFDLRLFSQSTEDYITKLDDGEFEVRLPIKEELQGKELEVYFVGENDKIDKYDVTIKDGFAVFKTTHFSIYTLAEKVEEDEEEPAVTDNTTTDEPTTSTTDNQTETSEEKPVAEEKATTDTKEEAPKTGDNIYFHITTLIIGLICFGSSIYLIRKD